MFRMIFQLLLLGFLAVLGYEYFVGDRVQSWSYCGDDLRQEKQKMEREVKGAMRAVGSGAEVSWKENADCITATVRKDKRLTSFLMSKLRERF